MTTVRELVVRWGFDVDEKQLENIDDSIERIKEGLFAVGAAATAAAATLFGFAKATANAADFVKDTATAIGVSTEMFQRLGYAAQLNGSSAEEMGDSLRYLSRAMNEAKDPGSEAAKTFRRLGVSTTDASGRLRSADQVLLAISDRFKAMADGPEKVALSMELMGRGGARMIQTLNNGSAALGELGDEFASFGGVMDSDAIEKATAFNDELDRLTALAKAVMKSVGMGIIPVMHDAAVELRNWVLANKDLIKTRLKSFLEGLSDFLRKVWWAARGVVNVTWGMYKAIDFLLKPVGGLANAFKYAALALGLFASGAMIQSLFQIFKSIRTIGTALGIVNAKALLVPILIGALAAAIFLIVDDIIAYMEGRPSFLGYLLKNKDKILAQLKAWMDKAKEWVLNAIEKLTQAFFELFGVPKDEAAEAAQFIRDAFELAFNFLGGLIKGLYGLIASVLQAVVSFIVDLIRSPGEVIENLGTRIMQVLADVLKGIIAFVGEMGATMSELLGGDPSSWTEMWDVIKEYTGIAIDWIAGKVGNFLNSIPRMIASIVRGISNIISVLVQTMASLLSSGPWEAVKTLFSGGWNLIKAAGSFITEGTEASTVANNGVNPGRRSILDVGKGAAAVSSEPSRPMFEFANPFANASPMATVPPSVVAGATNTANQSTTMQTTVNVTAPAGTDAQGVADATRRAVEDAHKQLMRETQRATTPVVKY